MTESLTEAIKTIQELYSKQFSNAFSEDQNERLHSAEEKLIGNLSEILQALRLMNLVKNTTIDLTPRERSLLDLLLEKSLEEEKDKSVPAYGYNIHES